jgi:hypothetical protein
MDRDVMPPVSRATGLPRFDCDALFRALDAQRRERRLGRYELADEMWEQSADLNATRSDHPLCGGAVARLQTRQARDLTWAELAPEFCCPPSRLTNLRTVRFADMDLTMRVTQWLAQPAATFIHPAQW